MDITFYNNAFAASSLTITITLLILYISQKKVKQPTQTYFFAYLYISIIPPSLIILISYILRNFPTQEQLIYNLGNLYYCAQIILVFTLNYFLCKNFSIKLKKNIWYLSIPAYISLLMLLNNESTKYIFYINNSFLNKGPFYFLMWGHCILYALYFAYNQLKNRQLINRKTTVIASFFVIYVSLSLLIQQLVENLQVLPFANSLFMVITFILLENPLLEEDSLTGALNNDCFNNYLEGLNNSNIKITLVHVKNIELVNTLNNQNQINSLYAANIKRITVKFKNILIFRLTQNTFAFAYKKETQLIKLHNYLNKEIERLKILNTNAFPVFLNFADTVDSKNFSSSKTLKQAIKWGIKELEIAITKAPITLNEESAIKYERNQKIDKEIHNAISKKLIELKIQPFYNVRECKVTSGEALARLQIPELGYVPCGEFISIAEKNGTINEFGLVVINEICNFYNTIILPVDKIAINISMLHFMQRTLPDDFIKILEINNISASKFIIEITETSEVLDWDILKLNMRKLKDAGFTLSLDDFGTGFASFEYFMTLPFDIIKFDRNLLLAAQGDSSALIALTSTVNMVKSLGFTTVIEGVETKEQNSIALKLGIDYIQGFLYGRPMALSDFGILVNSYNEE